MVRLYHGSAIELPVGLVLTGRGDQYENAWSHTDFYAVLEQFRPAHCIPHREAVFMVADPDDIDLAGGATDFVFELEVDADDVSRHDLNWSSEISMLISDGHVIDSPEVASAAQAYWAGTPHYNESVWEYMTKAARIVRCEPYETFEVVPVQGGRPRP